MSTSSAGVKQTRCVTSRTTASAAMSTDCDWDSLVSASKSTAPNVSVLTRALRGAKRVYVFPTEVLADFGNSAHAKLVKGNFTDEQINTAERLSRRANDRSGRPITHRAKLGLK